MYIEFLDYEFRSISFRLMRYFEAINIVNLYMSVYLKLTCNLFMKVKATRSLTFLPNVVVISTLQLRLHHLGRLLEAKIITVAPLPPSNFGAC